MGDIIHSMIALQFIKQIYPSCTIDWIVEDGFKGILQNNNDINNILSINLKSIKKKKLTIFDQIKILKQYAKNNYDIVIDAQGLLKSAIVSKIVGKKIENSKIIGFDKNSTRERVASLFYSKKITIPYEKNVILRNIELLCKSLNIDVTKDMIQNKKVFLFSNAKNRLNIDNYIVFVVGASVQNKIYPKEKFKKLADLLNKKIIVVWGNAYELKIANYLKNRCSNVDTAPKGDLNDLKTIIKNSDFVIGSDTGPTHIAWGLNVASITIFGNTPEYRNTYITNINKVITSSSKVNALKLDKSDFSINEIDEKNIFKLYISIQNNINSL